MRRVKLFVFSGGFVSDVNLEAASDTINNWVTDNGVHLVTVSIASGHPGIFYASVIYEEDDNAKGQTKATLVRATYRVFKARKTPRMRAAKVLGAEQRVRSGVIRSFVCVGMSDGAALIISAQDGHGKYCDKVAEVVPDQ